MAGSGPESGLQLRTRLGSDGRLELSLVDTAVPVPAADEIIVEMHAAPINPSDLGLLLAGADLNSVSAAGSHDRPIVTAQVAEGRLRAMAPRFDQSLAVGNEGAGIVVDAGASAAAQALLGRTVAVRTDSAYSQYVCAPISRCIALPSGITPKEGAACFINPLTALGMVETMRREGHGALVHTAAASNLGQMLNRLCRAQDIPLVNIVRRPDQVEALRNQGAAYVCDTSAKHFRSDLDAAMEATGATLAFDAVGGGSLAGQILAAMERVASGRAGAYSRYGSSVHKQLYIYGALDLGPTQINRTFGFAWGVGGWLLTYFLDQIGPAAVQGLHEQVVAGLRSTFASQYAREISLSEALQLENLLAYSRRATGEKYLINPDLGARYA